MPTYEFRCTDCGNTVEVFQRIGDQPPTVCDVCGGTLRKVFHPAGIVFRGSGFYATDSRSRSKTSSDGGGSSEGDKKPSPKPSEGEGKSSSKKEGAKEPTS
jgi:putative FmdB family regulatory protein